jgi:transposase-like protein
MRCLSRPEIGLHIKWNKMNKKRTRKEAIVEEYLGGKATYRELSVRYGYSLGTLHRWVKEAEQEKPVKRMGVGSEAQLDKEAEEGLEEEVKRGCQEFV